MARRYHTEDGCDELGPVMEKFLSSNMSNWLFLELWIESVLEKERRPMEQSELHSWQLDVCLLDGGYFILIDCLD